MAVPGRPLLCRAPLRPGESLPSFLARLAELNRYDPPRLLEQAGQDGVRDRVRCPARPETFERLAALTMTGCAELYQASAHRFAGTLVPPGAEAAALDLPGRGPVPLLPRSLDAKHLRPAASAQFCPECLRADLYHRLAWLPLAAAVCPHHGSLLLAACPRCGAQVSIHAVVRARCAGCGADLAEAVSTPVVDDGWGLFSQQVIQAWLWGAAPPDAPRLRTFPDESPAALYRVLDGLRWAVATAVEEGGAWGTITPAAGEEAWDAQAKPAPALAGQLYAAALRGLADWPEGFYAFLAAYAARGGRSPTGRLHEDLGTLYSRWLLDYWRGPAFGFVQEAFDRYAAAHYAGTPAASRSRRCREAELPCVSLAEAAALLGTTPGMVERLVAVGRLAYYDSRRTPRFRYLPRDAVLALGERWQETVALGEAARALDLGERTVVELTQVGLLAAERGPAVDGYAHWLFSRQTVEDCAGRIRERVTMADLPPPPDRLSLAGAVQVLSTLGLNAAGVLGLVREGRLRGYSPPGEETVPGRLLFSRAEAQNCLAAFKAERGWVDREEIARRMGVKHTVVSKWVRAGLLTPLENTPGHSQHFDRATVEQFVAGHVFTAEAATLLGVDKDTVIRWTKTGRLVPVSGPGQDTHRYLFRREDVERLRPENRLTAPQAAQVLGVSHAQVLRYAAQGQLVPVSGPGVDAAGHYLFVVPPGGLVIPGQAAATEQIGAVCSPDAPGGAKDGG